MNRRTLEVTIEESKREVIVEILSGYFKSVPTIKPVPCSIDDMEESIILVYKNIPYSLSLSSIIISDCVCVAKSIAVSWQLK